MVGGLWAIIFWTGVNPSTQTALDVEDREDIEVFRKTGDDVGALILVENNTGAGCTGCGGWTA
jgi:hypothetical protein